MLRNPCVECVYYHSENNTCQSKKCATGGTGRITWLDRLCCMPCRPPFELEERWRKKVERVDP